MPKKIAIVGSSHVSWWEHAIATRQIPQPYDDITFIGRGAMPIWGDFIRSGIAGTEDRVDQVFLLLGDFRHGNRVLTDDKFLRTGNTSGNFLNIAKELISDENDKILLQLIISFLQELRGRLGPRLRILFWSLTFREFQSLENGRYGGRGNYHHPVWNLVDLVDRFRDVAVDTTPLTALPIHSFFLDASGHPNVKGHAFLYRVLNGFDALAAYESVRADFDTCSPLLFPPDADRYRVNITGDSIAFKALEKAARTRYFLMPAAWEVNDLKTAKAAAGQYDRVVYLSGLHFQDEDPQQINAKIAGEKTRIARLNPGLPVLVIFWDQWAREVISKRPEYHKHYLPKAAEGYAERIEQAFAPYQVGRLSTVVADDADGMVEFGGSFYPSGKGYAALFHLMISEAGLPMAFARYQQVIAHCLGPAGGAELARRRLARMQGYFDGIGVSGEFCGWAFDLDAPQSRVPVYIFAGNQPIASPVADRFRADLVSVDGGDGYCGYSSGPLALSQLRNLHAGIEIRASFDEEGRFELANSPVRLDQEALARLALAAIKPWQGEYQATKQQRGDFRIPSDGSSLFVAKKIASENDPSIYPRTDLVLDHAVVESVKRLPAFFKAVVRARVIGGVYRADGSLEPAALGSSALGVFQLADRILTTTPTRHIDAECLYGGMILNHYGHFIIEGLARAHAFQRFASLPIVFTLPYADISQASGLPAYIKAMFELLGIAQERIILVQETTSFKKLVIPKVGMRWWDFLDAGHQQAMAAQVKLSFGADYPLQKHGSIYLSRSKLGTSHDGNVICGEAEFENYLRTQGFTVVYPETLTVKEQVRLFCSARNAVGFVGSGFHTLLLCADAPEKIVYLNRKKAAVNPQFPLIDKVLHIDGHYLDGVIRNSARITLVDFEAVARALLASGLVQEPFDAGRHDLETEFGLLSDWLDIKKKGKRLSVQDRKRLEAIAGRCLNRVVVEEVQGLLC